MQDITTQQRFHRAALVGLSGGIVACVIMLNDRGFHDDWGFVRAATAGAFCAGLMLARGFGGEGGWGWFRALMTFVGCTLVGAGCAVPLLGLDTWLMNTEGMEIVTELAGMALLGPAYVMVSLVEHYFVWAVWAAGFITAQGVVIWGR